ncbi:thioesterase family protein [Lacticigenium naphthae]|uniref:thioesterase family protein n=1 Tax=Lacticigenium naphthae TaxID=515351 RepID=UPI000423EBFC|nr:thioesterase family protein [Lacticigenium naphthae]
MKKHAEKIFVVRESDTAKEIGSGRLAVLSTPHLIGYMENTAMLLLEKDLEATRSSVGIEINLKHIAATAIGKEVVVKVSLGEATDKIYTFSIEAYVEDKLIGKANHKRAVINREEFLQNSK